MKLQKLRYDASLIMSLSSSHQSQIIVNSHSKIFLYVNKCFKNLFRRSDFTQKYNQKDNDCLCQIIFIAICNAMVSSVF